MYTRAGHEANLGCFPKFWLGLVRFELCVASLGCYATVEVGVGQIGLFFYWHTGIMIMSYLWPTLVYSRQCGFWVMNSLSAGTMPYLSRDNTIPSSPSGCQSRRPPETTCFPHYFTAFFIHSLSESHLP